MTESKDRYGEFCLDSDAPLQFQPWWLDAVCGAEGWNAVLFSDGGGRVRAAMPWYIKRKFGLKMLGLPPFSAYGGPWLDYPADAGFKLNSRYSFEKKALTALIGQLPRFDFFALNFHLAIQNWLPFHWAGFRQTTRYTYVFDRIESLDDVRQGMKNTLRTDLRKAAGQAFVSDEPGAWETVFKLHQLSIQRKGFKHESNKQIFKQLHEALHARAQCLCLLARDRETRQPHAGLYLVFDQRMASVLFTGVDPAFKSSCAIYLLFEEALAFCAGRGIGLDFEGSMDPGVEHTFRSFGARQQPYFRVLKTGRLGWMLLK